MFRVFELKKMQFLQSDEVKSELLVKNKAEIWLPKNKYSVNFFWGSFSILVFSDFGPSPTLYENIFNHFMSKNLTDQIKAGPYDKKD